MLALLGLVAALAGLGLAACSSSSPSGSSASSTSSAPNLFTPSTSTPAGSSTGTVPAVADPTDQNVEPVISAGTSPPPSTLVTKNLVVGTGTTASASSTVVVKYVGADYSNGTDFDASTWQSGMAATFPLNMVVPGFEEGIVGMKVGGRREIVIPPSLGYGATGQPPAVSPNETLVFVVDLKAVQ